nr:hypothetical protein B0A51_17398 [Rachicladosporium sp. CCFEE 5018]
MSLQGATHYSSHAPHSATYIDNLPRNMAHNKESAAQTRLIILESMRNEEHPRREMVEEADLKGRSKALANSIDTQADEPHYYTSTNHVTVLTLPLSHDALYIYAALRRCSPHWIDLWRHPDWGFKSCSSGEPRQLRGHLPPESVHDRKTYLLLEHRVTISTANHR